MTHLFCILIKYFFLFWKRLICCHWLHSRFIGRYSVLCMIAVPRGLIVESHLNTVQKAFIYECGSEYKWWSILLRTSRDEYLSWDGNWTVQIGQTTVCIQWKLIFRSFGIVNSPSWWKPQCNLVKIIYRFFYAFLEV